MPQIQPKMLRKRILLSTGIKVKLATEAIGHIL